MQLYIHRDGQQFGPYSIEQVREYLATGNLQPGDLSWYEGAAEWVPLAQVAGVAPAAAAPPPPPVSAPVAELATPTATLSGKIPQTTKESASNIYPISQKLRSIGARNMGVGALFFFGGSGVTCYSYMSATENPGGGSYFVAWGAVLFGAIQFVKGLIQYCKA